MQLHIVLDAAYVMTKLFSASVKALMLYKMQSHFPQGNHCGMQSHMVSVWETEGWASPWLDL